MKSMKFYIWRFPINKGLHKFLKSYYNDKYYDFKKILNIIECKGFFYYEYEYNYKVIAFEELFINIKEIEKYKRAKVVCQKIKTIKNNVILNYDDYKDLEKGILINSVTSPYSKHLEDNWNNKTERIKDEYFNVEETDFYYEIYL